MTRKLTAACTVLLLLGLLMLDRATSEPLNPYQAPPMIALGSGVANTGAHCASLPDKE